MTKLPELYSNISVELTLVFRERQKQIKLQLRSYFQTVCRISSVFAHRMPLIIWNL